MPSKYPSIEGAPGGCPKVGNNMNMSLRSATLRVTTSLPQGLWKLEAMSLLYDLWRSQRIESLKAYQDIRRLSKGCE